jgi:hypothetical protein
MNDLERYEAATRRMNRLVKDAAYAPAHPADQTAPSLRVGVNTAMSDHAALVKTLIDAGLITEDVYTKNLADFMEKEANRAASGAYPAP